MAEEIKPELRGFQAYKDAGYLKNLNPMELRIAEAVWGMDGKKEKYAQDTRMPKGMVNSAVDKLVAAKFLVVEPGHKSATYKWIKK